MKRVFNYFDENFILLDNTFTFHFADLLQIITFLILFCFDFLCFVLWCDMFLLLNWLIVHKFPFINLKFKIYINFSFFILIMKSRKESFISINYVDDLHVKWFMYFIIWGAFGSRGVKCKSKLIFNWKKRIRTIFILKFSFCKQLRRKIRPFVTAIYSISVLHTLRQTTLVVILAKCSTCKIRFTSCSKYTTKNVI